MDPPASILLVDDREEDLFALRQVLEQPDRELVLARSGPEALRCLLQQDFALILLDVKMPEMDGFEVASIIKQRQRSRHTPILFLTGASDEASRRYRGYSVGAVDFLAKPVDTDVLRAKVNIFVELYRKDQKLQAQSAELELANQKRYRSLAEAIPQVLFTTKPDGAVDFCNRRWTDLTGLTPAETEGWGWLRALHPDDAGPTEARWRQRIADGKILEAQFRIRRAADGGYRWHLCRALPETDKDGQVVGWLATATDFDDQKHIQAQAEGARLRAAFLADAAEALAASLEIESALQEVARLAVSSLCEACAVHLVGRDGKIPQTLAVAEAAGKRVSWKERLNDAAWVARVLESRRPELLLDDPELRRLEIRSAAVAPLNARGRTFGVLTLAADRVFDDADLAMTIDLAHRCALAVDNKILYQDAQDAVRARDDFLSVASHELRTPLTPLLLHVQSLQRAKEALPEKALKRIALVERQVHQLTRLIDRLLDISRIASGKLTLELENVDLASLASEAVARLGDDLARAGCKLTLSAEEPVRGKWDRMRLDQIVTNLVSNALKYGHGEPVEVTVNGDDTTARLTVRDHGIGIAPDDQERIFHRFERAVSTGYGGLGLGLWIVHEIVSALGGSVRIESSLGHGAAFIVELPRVQPSEGA